jgi:uncharacterized membrane protein
MGSERGEENTSKISVLYAGHGEIVTVTYSSGFDYDISNYLAVYSNTTRGLESDSRIQVTRIGGPAIIDQFPNSLDELQKYDVIIMGDVGSDTLLITPDVMRGNRGVNRLKLIREYVKQGGGFLMCAGWGSFGGYKNNGRYHGTPVEEVLPVYIKDGDDRVEVNDGFQFSVIDKNHPTVRGLDWDNAEYYMLGYNRVRAKPEATVVAKFEDDPVLVVWDYFKGRSVAFACAFELHWAGTFVNWSGYGKFLSQVVMWLAQKNAP